MQYSEYRKMIFLQKYITLMPRLNMKIKNYLNPKNIQILFLFKRIFQTISKENKRKTILVFFIIALQSFLELFFILALSYMAMALTDPEALNGTPLFKVCYRLAPGLREWANNPRYLLLMAGCIVVLVSVLKNCAGFLAANSTARLSERIAIDIGNEIFSRFLYGNYAWHLSKESGPTFQCMLWRNHVATLLMHQLSMYACILTLIVLFFSLVSQEPVLTSLVIVVTGCVGILLYRGIRRNIDKSAKEAVACELAETQTVLCATRGIREVLIYRQQDTFLSELCRNARRGVSARVFNAIAPTMPTWVLEATGFTVVVLSLGYLVFVEQADIPRIAVALSLLLLTAWRVLPYANRVVSFQVAIRGLYPTVDAVLNLLDAMRKQPSRPLPEPAADFTMQRRITLRNVSFRYPDTECDCLHELNLEIPIGKKVGLIGPSGAGKSTLVSILSGLLPPTSGEILVDGKLLTPERAAAFARRIGYVSQQPFLFAGTLADNIAFSQWKKSWNKDDVLQACRRASIDFVDDHPLGLQQPIGENGLGLSGGQAQRVSIARAMYANPSLLIFDEATSALDQSNENSIQRTIQNLAESVTCVIVAHRLTTVETCDIIIWMDMGRIVMQGPPKTVLPQYITQNTT